MVRLIIMTLHHILRFGVMTTTTSTVLSIVDGLTDHHGQLSTPSKAAFSGAQNPIRSITPGYRETDIQFLTMEAGRPILPRNPSSDEVADMDVLSRAGRDVEARKELYRQIAVSFGAFTLSSQINLG